MQGFVCNVTCKLHFLEGVGKPQRRNSGNMKTSCFISISNHCAIEKESNEERVLKTTFERSVTDNSDSRCRFVTDNTGFFLFLNVRN